ncbi:MAG: aminotransferase class V-fold PLP-dependent enzyme [Candidatus Aminicenantes bacterium]|nr:aminotransferase class V-fold PLP-dependent enzyme [Candidatus Aminicenantes bacterium]
MEFSFLRDEIVGIDAAIATPFGERLMVYGDYTASGRCLRFIEQYLMRLQRHYANSHTEDDITGRNMTRLLRQAEGAIKDAVNAGPRGRIVSLGFGSTAAIDRFQHIIGTAFPPATRALLAALAGEFARKAGLGADFGRFLETRQPVVFIGPYEHHSNELTWREGLCSVVVVRLSPDGGIDLGHLEELLRKPEYGNRLRIGSFSAASNVTGLISPVREIAGLLHRFGALACFDYAASAPYAAIDMNPPPGADGEDASLDAVFISPHKFIGGPGSSGILVFNERVYRADLAPSVSGGGTVAYVGRRGHDFFADVEEREKAGTPGVLQTIKAALSFLVKEAVTVERIERRERELLTRAFERWTKNPRLEILGPLDPGRRIGIVSFNIREESGVYLHPKYVTALLNDLFGIQSRAGCSCAGPYGHELLGIDEAASEKYRAAIRSGYEGVKPGWCRVGFHFAMDDAEADYLIEAVDFVGRKGGRFLSEYRFDLKTGSWTHVRDPMAYEDLSLAEALRTEGEPLSRPLPASVRRRLYRDYLAEAEAGAEERRRTDTGEGKELPPEIAALRFFALPPEAD